MSDIKERIKGLLFEEMFPGDRYAYWRMRGWVALVGFLVAAASAGALLLFGANEASRKNCRETAERMDLEWDYSFWTPCMVEVDGTLVPIDNVRVNDHGEVLS